MGLTTSATSYQTMEQELARMKLAAKHRASHEMLLKRIMSAAQDAVAAFKQSSTLGSIEEAEQDFQENFRYYYEMLDENIWQQTMEASSLCNQQSLENQAPTPVLQVSFPFYGVFNEIVNCIDNLVRTAKHN